MARDHVVGGPLVLALLVAAPAAAQVDPEGFASAVRTLATTRIEQPATLTSSQDLAFATQTSVAATRLTAAAAATAAAVSTSVAATASNVTTVAGTQGAGAQSSAGGPAASLLRATTTSSIVAPVTAVAPATFTVAGDGGQAISVTVPPTVDLERNGGSGSALLSTTSSLAEGPQFLGGNFAGSGTLSFAVGGQVMLASNSAVSAGTYNGVLMVVAQYN